MQYRNVEMLKLDRNGPREGWIVGKVHHVSGTELSQFRGQCTFQCVVGKPEFLQGGGQTQFGRDGSMEVSIVPIECNEVGHQSNFRGDGTCQGCIS
jgi:hypothetical protein